MVWVLLPSLYITETFRLPLGLRSPHSSPKELYISTSLSDQPSIAITLVARLSLALMALSSSSSPGTKREGSQPFQEFRIG